MTGWHNQKKMPKNAKKIKKKCQKVSKDERIEVGPREGCICLASPSPIGFAKVSIHVVSIVSQPVHLNLV